MANDYVCEMRHIPVDKLIIRVIVRVRYLRAAFWLADSSTPRFCFGPRFSIQFHAAIVHFNCCCPPANRSRGQLSNRSHMLNSSRLGYGVVSHNSPL